MYTQDEIYRDLLAGIQSGLGDNDEPSPYSVKSILSTSIADYIHKISSYYEWLFRESFWDKATLPESIVPQLELLNYSAKFRQGATAILTFGNFAGSFTVDKFDTFSTDDGTTFSAIAPKVIQVGDTSLSVVQGMPQTRNHTIVNKDTSDIAHRFTLENLTNIDSTNFFIRSTRAGVTTTLSSVESVYTYTTATGTARNVFDARFLSESSVEIQILNDIVEDGDIIEFNYLNTEGRLPQVIAPNSIQTVTKAYTDNQTTQTLPNLTVNNATSSTFGSDSEPIGEIKRNALNSYLGNNKLITASDYEQAFRAGAGQSDKVQVTGEKELREALGIPFGTKLPSTVENVITAYAVNQVDEDTTHLNYTQLNNSNENVNVETLERQKGASDTIVYGNLNIIRLNFHSRLRYLNSSQGSKTVAERAIATGLKNLYGVRDNTAPINNSVNKSDYIALIDNVDNVIHHRTDVEVIETLPTSIGETMTTDVPPQVSTNLILSSNHTLHFKNATNSIDIQSMSIWVVFAGIEGGTGQRIEKRYGTIDTSGNFVYDTNFGLPNIPSRNVANLFNSSSSILTSRLTVSGLTASNMVNNVEQNSFAGFTNTDDFRVEIRYYVLETTMDNTISTTTTCIKETYTTRTTDDSYLFGGVYFYDLSL